jgi:hypothetical protein
MNSSSKGILKMTLIDLRTSLYVVFSVLLVIYLVLSVISVGVASDAEVTIGGLSPLHIFVFIAGMVGVKESLAYALGMSVRRRDYYVGVLVAGIIVAAVCSFAISLFSMIENALFAQFDSQVKVFHMIGFESVGHLGRWIANFIFLTFEFTLGFLFALLYRRFGSIGLYVLFGVFLIAAALIHLFGAWEPIFTWFGSISGGLEAAMWLLILLAFNLVVSYMLMRRVTV